MNVFDCHIHLVSWKLPIKRKDSTLFDKSCISSTGIVEGGAPRFQVSS